MPCKHDVVQGNCISSIAFAYGFHPDTIWNDSANAELKQKRKDPNTLLPGDVVTIPDKQLREETCTTDKRHTFVRLAVPEKFRARILIEDEPQANARYRINLDGDFFEGTTDADGRLAHPIRPDAKHVQLTVYPGTDKELQYELDLGHLDPIEEVSGVQARLSNLGFECGAVDGQMGPATEQALKLFQVKNNLPVNGKADAATLDKLKGLHGS